jgi:hypothetical protein
VQSSGHSTQLFVQGAGKHHGLGVIHTGMTIHVRVMPVHTRLRAHTGIMLVALCKQLGSLRMVMHATYYRSALATWTVHTAHRTAHHTGMQMAQAKEGRGMQIPVVQESMSALLTSTRHPHETGCTTGLCFHNTGMKKARVSIQAHATATPRRSTVTSPRRTSMLLSGLARITTRHRIVQLCGHRH